MSRPSPLAASAASELDPLQNVRKGDAVYHAIRRSILLGHIKSGEQLLEQRIAKQLNCSQGTVREAFLRLEQDGLVARRGYRGTVVSTTSVQEAAQMVEIRIQIESTGVLRSVTSIDAKALAELTAITRDMDEAVRALDFYRCSELDRLFHMTLFRQSSLPALEPILNRCTLHIHRFTFQNAETMEADTSLGQNHRGLLRTIRTGDATAAADSIKSHIGQVIQRWAPPLVQELGRMHARGEGPL